MTDPAGYRILWEYAGLEPPNFHEDELQAIADALNATCIALYHGAQQVNKELMSLQSSVSSVAFDALRQAWHENGLAAVTTLASTLDQMGTALGQAVVEIWEWKARLTVAVGLADMGLTLEYVATGGLALLATKAGVNVAAHEVQAKLSNLVDELESKLVSIVIDNTPLRDVEHRVATELQGVIDAAIAQAGTTLGHSVGGH